MQHVVQVAPELAPTEVWTYVVNGKAWPGTGASEPIVVNEGDKVEITFVNGGSKAMNVTMPHSIDFHSAEVAPNKYYKDIEPGKRLTIKFTADHPGVFMYHCATQPVLTHVANGMAGMMVVKPKGLPAVDKELWVTQSEYYLGKPGAGADQAKMTAEAPDVIAFNGYANQYKSAPISVKRGERVRMYVLNAGPSKWSAFHVIGTVFDRTVVEGTVGRDSQTMNFAPSQGGWAEFTLAQEGNFPFVTHSFGDMVRGAAGILHTTKAPAAARRRRRRPRRTRPPKGIGITLGEMWIKTTAPTAKAGKVTFNVSNPGATMHQFAIGADPLTMDGDEPRRVGRDRQGRHAAHGRHRDRHRRPQARQVHPLLPDGRPLRGRPEAPLHRLRVTVRLPRGSRSSTAGAGLRRPLRVSPTTLARRTTMKRSSRPDLALARPSPRPGCRAAVAPGRAGGARRRSRLSARVLGTARQAPLRDRGTPPAHGDR